MNNTIMNILNKPLIGDFNVIHAMVLVVVVIMSWMLILEVLKFVKESQKDSILDTKETSYTRGSSGVIDVQRLSFTSYIRSKLKKFLTAYKFNKLLKTKYRVILKITLSDNQWDPKYSAEIENTLSDIMPCVHVINEDTKLYLVFGCNNIPTRNKCLDLMQAIREHSHNLSKH